MKQTWPKVIWMVIVVFLTSGVCLTAAAKDWTNEDKETWKKAVKRVVTTPPCCGACSVLEIREGRQAYKYITGEDSSKEAEKIYKDHETKLLEAFRYFNPSRYEYWFGNSLKGDTKP
jgi:hypothetical protein